MGCEQGGQRPHQDSQDSSSATIEDYLLPTHLEVPSFAPPAQLAPTIYPSEEGVTERGALGRKGQGPPMLSAAVRIHLDPQKNVKVRILLLPAARLTWATASLVHAGAWRPPSLLTDRLHLLPQEFLVTIRLHKATLRHYMAPPEQSWHSQVSKGAWEVTWPCDAGLLIEQAVKHY